MKLVKMKHEKSEVNVHPDQVQEMKNRGYVVVETGTASKDKAEKKNGKG